MQVLQQQEAGRSQNSMRHAGRSQSHTRGTQATHQASLWCAVAVGQWLAAPALLPAVAGPIGRVAARGRIGAVGLLLPTLQCDAHKQQKTAESMSQSSTNSSASHMRSNFCDQCCEASHAHIKAGVSSSCAVVEGRIVLTQSKRRLGQHKTSLAKEKNCSPHPVPCTLVPSCYCCAPAAGPAAAAALPAAPAVLAALGLPAAHSSAAVAAAA